MDKIIERAKKYNQQFYVEYLLENPFLISEAKNYYTNLKLLTTYLKEIKGMKPKEREKFLYDFVEKNDIYYNKVTDYIKIDKALKAGGQSSLKIIKPIKIYRKEFDYINNLDLDISRRKVIFSAYCFYRLRDAVYPNSAGNPYIPKHIVTIAKLKSTSKVKDDIRYYFNELQNKYFDWTPCKDTSIILPFVKNMPECSEKDEYCTIINFDKLYLYYDYFTGDKSIAFCKNCGSAFRDKNYKKAGARQQYCNDCSVKTTEEYKIITCESCGQKALISSLSRRKYNLCDKCYEKYRSNYNHSYDKK